MGPAQSSLHNRIPVEIIEEILLHSFDFPRQYYSDYLGCRHDRQHLLPLLVRKIRLVCRLLGEVVARLHFSKYRLRFGGSGGLHAFQTFCKKIRPQTLSHIRHLSLEGSVEFSDMTVWLEPLIELLCKFPVELRTLCIKPGIPLSIGYYIDPKCYILTSNSIPEFSRLEELSLGYPDRLRYFFEGPPPAPIFAAHSTPLFPCLRRIFLRGEFRCHFSLDHLARFSSAQHSPRIECLKLSRVPAEFVSKVLPGLNTLREFLVSPSGVDRRFPAKALLIALRANHGKSLQRLELNFLGDTGYDFEFDDIWRLLERLHHLKYLTIGLGRQTRHIGLPLLSAIINRANYVLPSLETLHFATVSGEAELCHELTQGLLSCRNSVPMDARFNFLIPKESSSDPPDALVSEMENYAGDILVGTVKKDRTWPATGDFPYHTISVKLPRTNSSRADARLSEPFFATETYLAVSF